MHHNLIPLRTSTTCTSTTCTSPSVFLSSTEGGPADFCVQLESLGRQLEEVMEAANTVPLVPVAAGLAVPGTPCLARYTEDTTIYRYMAYSPSEGPPPLHPTICHPSPLPFTPGRWC